MPSCSVYFRAVCGAFYWRYLHFMKKRAILAAAMRVNTVIVSGPTAIILVCLVALLLRSGDIEVNPGPPKPTKATKQTTLTASTSEATLDATLEVTSEPTISDVLKVLTEMNTKWTSMDKKWTSMDKKIDNMHTSVQEQLEKVQSDLTEVIKENHDLKDKIVKLEEKMEKMEEKLDDLEGRSRRNNLLFHGIPHPQGRQETWVDCENAIKSALKDQMGLEDADDIHIERAHRLRGGAAPRPIIACFGNFKDKERIFAGRRTLRERHSEIFVSEDFSPRVHDKRRQLLPFLKQAKEAGKRAFLRFDTLVVDGKVFVYDSTSDGLMERGQRGAR